MSRLLLNTEAPKRTLAYYSTRIGTCLLASLGLACSALAAEITVLAPNAAKESVSDAISVFEKAPGNKVVAAWTGTEAITNRIAEGEAVDVVINAAQNIDRQSKDGKLTGATRTDFARSSIGVAIPAHAGYNYLVSRVNKIVLDMERAAAEVVNIVTENGNGK